MLVNRLCMVLFLLISLLGFGRITFAEEPVLIELYNQRDSRAAVDISSARMLVEAAPVYVIQTNTIVENLDTKQIRFHEVRFYYNTDYKQMGVRNMTVSYKDEKGNWHQDNEDKGVLPVEPGTTTELAGNILFYRMYNRYFTDDYQKIIESKGVDPLRDVRSKLKW